MRALDILRAIAILAVAFAASSGGGGDCLLDGPDAGGDGGDGGPIEPPPNLEIYGSWTRACDLLTDQDAIEACLGAPESFVFGRAVLDEPATFVSEGGFCADGTGRGTFAFEEDVLELFHCGDGDSQVGPDAVGLVFQTRWEAAGERLILSDGDTEYVFTRDSRAGTPWVSARVIEIGRTCNSRDAYLRGHTVLEGEAPGWFSTLVFQGGETLMDELIQDVESTQSFNWSFYDADHRGLQTKSFALEPGVPASFCRIFRDEDLTPIHAIEFEMDDCDSSNESDVRAFEHDFVRGVTFRRFWTKSAGTTATVDVDLAGTIEEVLVTLRTSTLANASELAFTLTSPGGTTVELLSAGTIPSEDSAQFEYTSFADDATKSLIDPELSSLEDRFVPAQPLAALAGEPMAGTWTLSVTRESGDVGGALTYFGLSLR